MNTAILKTSGRATGGGGDRSLPHGGSGSYRHYTPAGIGLWVFIGVATALFMLFIAAYIMRMNAGDWSPIAMPGQLWLSTALLVAGSAFMQLASRPDPRARERMRPLMLAGGICALAFLGSQLWAWQILLDMRVMPAGNPAASFFYLLTAMHGLHVLGGIAAWGWAAHRMQHGDTMGAAWHIGLCARYWHFLLAVWIVLYATFTGLTPELVAYICGR